MAKMPMEFDQTSGHVVRAYAEITDVERSYSAFEGMANSSAVNVALPGYTAIGVIGFYGTGSGVGSFAPTIYTIDMENQLLSFFGRNVSNANINVTKYWAYILYVKNT